MPNRNDGITIGEAFGVRPKERKIALRMLSAGFALGSSITKAGENSSSPEEMALRTERILKDKIGKPLPGIVDGLTEIQCDALMAIAHNSRSGFINLL